MRCSALFFCKSSRRILSRNQQEINELFKFNSDFFYLLLTYSLVGVNYNRLSYDNHIIHKEINYAPSES